MKLYEIVINDAVLMSHFVTCNRLKITLKFMLKADYFDILSCIDLLVCF